MDTVEAFPEAELNQMQPLPEAEELPVARRGSGRVDRSSHSTCCNGLIHFICLSTICQPLLEAASAEMDTVLVLSSPFLQHHEQRLV